MDVQALAQNFATFMEKHSGELRVVASTLETVIGVLPIDAQDKQRITESVGALQTAAGNIAAGASALSGATVEVTIAKEDIVAAVTDVVHETEQTLAGAGAGAAPGNG